MTTAVQTPLRLRIRTCPLCGGGSGAEADAPQCGAHVDADAARYGLEAAPVPLRRCSNCEMRFFDLLEDVNTEGQIYAHSALSMDAPRPRHHALARLIRVAGLGRTGLELGSGACHVGRLLPSDHGVTAIDRKPRSAGAGENLRFIDADITALADDIYPLASADWILLDNVLEHLPAFMPLLAQARRWLAPGGRFLVSVPNGRTLRRWLGGRQLREVYRPVEHVNIFDPATLDAAFASIGAAPQRIGMRPRSVFEAAMAASLLGWAPFGLYRVYAP